MDGATKIRTRPVGSKKITIPTKHYIEQMFSNKEEMQN